MNFFVGQAALQLPEVFEATKPERLFAVGAGPEIDRRRNAPVGWRAMDGVGEDRFYWVGAAGQLYKLQAKENVEAVLCDEKRAKDLDTKE